MNTARLRTYVELNTRKKSLRADLDAVQGEIDALMPEILEDFADSGTSNININGHTIYLTAQLWASPQDGDYERACDALEAAGLGEFVGRRFNSNTLSAWVREYVRDESGNYPEEPEESLPVALQGALAVSKKWDVRVLKATSKGRG